MAATRSIARVSNFKLKGALFSQQIKPQALVSARWASGNPAAWNYLWRPDGKFTCYG